MTKKTRKEKKAPTKMTPVQIVREKYGEKKGLVSELVGVLERRDGESKGDFEKRLMKVPCSKLLNLQKNADEIKKIGGRKAMIEAIHDFQIRQSAKKGDPKEDQSLKAHLERKSLSDLLDRYQSVQLKLRRRSR